MQYDPQRTEAMLAQLHELSAERQVVLFSQVDEVRDWAERHLSQDRDGVITLPGPTAAA